MRKLVFASVALFALVDAGAQTRAAASSIVAPAFAGNGMGISVRDFMTAAPDGSTDNTAAFRNAVAAVPSAGGVLVVPPAASCYISSGVPITKNVTVWVQAGACIKARPSSFATLFDFSGTTGAAVVGQGLLDGNTVASGDGAWGIRSTNDSNFIVEGVEIKNFSQSGVKLVQCARCSVHGIHSHGNGFYGAVFYGTTYSVLADSHLSGNAYYGAAIVADSNPGNYDVPALYNSISGNIVDGNMRGGINVDNNVQFLNVSDNNISGGGNGDTTFAAGILLQPGTGTQNITVSGNNVYNIDGICIRVEAGSSTIVGNKARKCTLHGIYVNRANDGTLTGNYAFDNSSSASAWLGSPADGIRLNNSLRWAVSGNVTGDRRRTPYQGYGIHELGTSDFNAVVGNAMAPGNQLGDYSMTGAASVKLQTFSASTFSVTKGAVTQVVNDSRIAPNSIFAFTPLGPGGAAFIKNHGPLFVSATSGASFTVSSGDSTAFDNNYAFTYIMLR